MSVEAQNLQPPTGTVTLLFTDVEGSTAGWERYADLFGEALQVHDRKLRAAITENRGFVVKTAGDAFMAAFGSAEDGILAALRIQRDLAEGDESPAWSAIGGIRVRIGLHTGVPTFRDSDYFGPAVNRAARISDAGRGGMILLSETTLRVAEGVVSPTVQLIDHGLHKLKDLGDPEHLFEFRQADLPAPSDDRLRTLEFRPHNFPAQVTSLVGRQRQLADLHTLISKRQSRLITLTGPGGTGKTRLALQVAVDRLQDFAGGVWLVDLSDIYDPAAVPAAIASALRLELPPGADAKATVIEYLRPAPSLLVLDNYEHVADAARVVSDLLRECRDLVCLVTSRELLRVSGESEYPVEPLSIPPPDAIDAPWATFESVQLFVERGQAARTDFELTDENAPVIAEICRRLDGIPLAIELAAARVRGMTPAQILQRMTKMFDLLASGQRDVPERQRTLRNAINWSYDLLADDEKELFAQLSAFAGGFFLEAAEEICTVPGVFDYVFSLRDKSLLKANDVAGETRYYMLSTIHEYATQKLKTQESLIAIKTAHSEYYLNLAKDWSGQLTKAGPDAAEIMRVYTLEADNLRSGMDWAAQSSNHEAAKEYAKILFSYLRPRGLYTELDVRLTMGEDAARALGDDVSLARFLNQRGVAANDRSDHATARPLFQESYALSQKMNDRPRMLVSLLNLGNLSWMTADFADARREWEEALALAVETNQPLYEAYLREDLAILDCQEDRTQDALVKYEASLALHRKVGNQGGLASALYNSSDVFRKLHEYGEALRRIDEAREIYTSLQDHYRLALTAVRASMLERERGDLDAAKQYAADGLRMAISSGTRHPQMQALLVQAHIAMHEDDFDAAESLLHQSQQIGQEVGDRKHVADVTAALAVLRSLQGRSDESVELFASARNAYREMRLPEAELAVEFQRAGLPVPDVSADLPGAAVVSQEAEHFEPFEVACSV